MIQRRRQITKSTKIFAYCITIIVHYIKLVESFRPNLNCKKISSNRGCLRNYWPIRSRPENFEIKLLLNSKELLVTKYFESNSSFKSLEVAIFSWTMRSFIYYNLIKQNSYKHFLSYILLVCFLLNRPIPINYSIYLFIIHIFSREK